MTQIIHGLSRNQLLARVFDKSLVAGAVTTILVKAAARAERDSRQQQGKPKKGGGF